MELRNALDDFLLYLEIEQNYSENTLRSYESDITKFMLFLEHHQRPTDLDNLIPSIVRRFIQFQMSRSQVSPRTMQRRISSLKSFCQYCLKEHMTNSDFMAGIKSPKSDTKLPVYMNLEELKQLFSSLEKDERSLSLRNETMFKLLATTGMRKSEIVHLTWGQLDLYSETIRILGKGKKRTPPPPSFHCRPFVESLQGFVTETSNAPERTCILKWSRKTVKSTRFELYL